MSSVQDYLNKKNGRLNLASSTMPGTMTAFGSNYLPKDYGFNDLASYEQDQRTSLGTNFKNKISGLKNTIQSQYDNALNEFKNTTASRRNTLATSLGDNAKKTFEMNNPWILEDLNSRGVFSSGTAVANAQAQAMKELELGNQTQLLDFDTESRGYERELFNSRLNALNSLDESGVSAEMQSEQDALDAALDLRRGKLEGDLASANSAREEALARDLAKQQGRNQLTGSLIGLGGTLGGAYLMGGGTTAVAGTTAGVGAVPGLSAVGANPLSLYGSGVTGTGTTGAAGAGGLGTVGGLAAIGGAGIGAAMLSRAAEKKGGTAAGILANPIGYQLNKAKELIKNPSETIKNFDNKVSRSLGFGAGKTADGNSIADLSRSVQSTQQQLTELKDAVGRGEISQEEYLAFAQPIINETANKVGAMAGRGSVYANAINKVWQDFQNAGLAQNTGNGFLAV